MGRKAHAYRGSNGPPSVDEAIASLAGSQHAVFAGWQLDPTAAVREALRRRVRAHRLHRLYRGVYSLVTPSLLSATARDLAAVLACGPEAVLSHRAAAHRHGLLPAPSIREVTAPRSRASHDGIVVHRSRVLAPADRAVVDGIPVTSVARTLVDLADALSERRLGDAIHEAEVQRLFDLKAVEGAMGRVPGRRGPHKLRRAIDAYGDGPPLTRREAEKRFFAMCAGHALPTPQVNVWIHGYEVDFYWPSARLAIETDGGAVHQTRKKFHEDRRRDRDLALHGVRSLRVTWQDLDDPDALARELAGLLSL